MTRQYWAQVGADNAAWLADDSRHGFPGGHDPWGIKDEGDGIITFTSKIHAMLRELPEHYDGSMSADGFIWVNDEGFKVLAVPDDDRPASFPL